MNGGQERTLGTYGVRLSHKVPHRGPSDAAGVPLYRVGAPVGDRYLPVMIAQFALGLFERFGLEGRSEDRDAFLVQAKWLELNAVNPGNGLAVWHHDFSLPKWNARAPWISAMAQGQGISVLLRAYQVTGDSKLLDVAQRAVRAFRLSIREGGVRSVDRSGRPFYEEVAVDPPGHILNGMVFALWGLWDFVHVTSDKVAQTDFETGVSSVEAALPEYDTGYWSRYSLLYPHQVASRFYHALHVNQLSRLHEMTGVETFRKVAHRWRGYEQSLVCSTRQRITYPYFRTRYLIERLHTFLRLS